MAPTKKMPQKTAAKPEMKAAAKSKQPQQKARKNSTEIAQENMCLTDYDIASDVLGSHKALIDKYGMALYEIDDIALRRIVSSKLNECASDQLDCFSYMHERGMYKTEPASPAKIRQARQKFQNGVQPMKNKKK